MESEPCLGPESALEEARFTKSRCRVRSAAVGCLVGGACLLLLAKTFGPRIDSGNASEIKDTIAMESVKKRRGSFLVLGDWGWDDQWHAWNLPESRCQKLIAEKMLETLRELGDVQFIINVGDSFYPNGVQNKQDPQWWWKWRNIYHEDLRAVPWYSVYGNHDYNHDAGCACGSDSAGCAQINADVNDRNFFYMPDLNWFREHPEMGLEVVGLDMNAYEWAWNREAPPEEQCSLEPCANTPCQEQCELNLKYRARDGFQLLKDRITNSMQKNLLVFSHYPTDYFWNTSQTPMLPLLRDSSKHHIEYFAGHRHSTDTWSTIPTSPNHNWLVGGGGGWSCDSNDQGFVVGKIDMDYNLETYSVLVPHLECCATSTTTTTTMTSASYAESQRRLWGGGRACKLSPDWNADWMGIET